MMALFFSLSNRRHRLLVNGHLDDSARIFFKGNEPRQAIRKHYKVVI